MKEILIYIHGKGGSAEEAAHYKPLFPNCEVIGFDYRSQTPWEAKSEFPAFFAQQRQRCDRLTLQMQETRKRLTHILAENTGRTFDETASVTGRDNFMPAQEALAFGLIDKIIDKR